MNRRKFIKNSFFVSAILYSPLSASEKFYTNSKEFILSAKDKIIKIIAQLKSEGTNLVLKVMNGKKYVFDPYVRYPYEGGIVDKENGCRIFFHAHRPNEYGHFHTFVEDEKGELIHLVLISMNKKGEPIGLATVNTWVTGDKYVKPDILKNYLSNFKMNRNSFKESRIIDFVEAIFEAYRQEIFTLFDEREEWIQNYAAKYYREPFEDRDYEVLSHVKIKV
ncbi:MAG: hypothetical protein D6830_06560 [Ignavibacteria bacterium]|nr:MAG: hypothetical protein D6830_06560 [Ignavibacteria bacterium]